MADTSIDERAPAVLVSVVINTYNRAASLAVTLDALRQSTYANFEVVVVNGPSNDATEELLAGWGDTIRVVTCPEVHLGRSRNIGVAAAAGDIVAFVDDDAVPESTWLEELVAAYDSPSVGGAGGIVFDHTGTKLQYQYSVSDRVGITQFDVEPPFDHYLEPGADPFLYLQGTNASFRRECLVHVGGFDEEIEFQHDDVEVCLRILDQGYELRPLSGAAVHHKYLPSHLREEMMLWTDPYPAVKNRVYFALRNGRRGRTVDEVHAGLVEYLRHVKGSADRFHNEGRLDREQWTTFHQRAEHGFEVGLRRGLAGERKSRKIGPPDRAAFRRFPTRVPHGRRLRVCFVSGEYPPIDHGGIGRYTADLAVALAEQGHDVHVVTASDAGYTTEFEDGVWVHRITVQDREVPGLERSVLKGNYLHLAALYHQVARIHERLPLDIVSAPIWNCEGLLCTLDDRFATVTTLMTTVATLRDIHPSWRDSAHVQRLVELERTTLRESRYLHPISNASLEQVRPHVSPGAQAPVMPVGERDRTRSCVRLRPDGGPTRVLFVGRLERRKGVDVLLAAVPGVLASYPDTEFVLVGKDTEHTELGETYRERFLREHADQPDVLSRVVFAGAATEDELWQHYADADIFCAPSRFESLGLVLIEAMMFGKPVVGSSVGGMPEIVAGNGLLARPGDDRSLLDCLCQLLSDPTLRARFGERSRELFEARWSSERAAERAADGYTAFADAHAQRTVGDESMRDRLAQVLSEVEGWPTTQARQVATALADARRYPFDRVSALAALLDEPFDVFIQGAYHTLFSREPDAEGYATYIDALTSGMRRVDVIRSLATSDEAINHRIDPSFIEELEAVSVARAIPNAAERLLPTVTSPGALRMLRGGVRLRQSGRSVTRLAGARAAARAGIEAAAQHLRVAGAPPPKSLGAVAFPTPQIPDPELYDAKVARLGQDLRLNIGCGEQLLPDYVNVDVEPFAGVELVADARRLPFDTRSVAEIASSHLVDQFREHELAAVVLPYWRSLLRSGGLVRVTCPNWTALVTELSKGEMTLEQFRHVTFGALDDRREHRLAMYTPETLADVLHAAGFDVVEIVAVDRRNGLSLDMELVGEISV